MTATIGSLVIFVWAVVWLLFVMLDNWPVVHDHYPRFAWHVRWIKYVTAMFALVLLLMIAGPIVFKTVHFADNGAHLIWSVDFNPDWAYMNAVMAL